MREEETMHENGGAEFLWREDVDETLKFGYFIGKQALMSVPSLIAC